MTFNQQGSLDSGFIKKTSTEDPKPILNRWGPEDTKFDTAGTQKTKSIGIGLRAPHYAQVIEERPNIGWFEVHSENFLDQAGATLSALTSIRQHYPISLHGVGLSLGSDHPLDHNHLNRLKQLIKHIDPFLVSEHLSWSNINGVYLPDLLPIVYNQENFDIFAKNISFTQDFLKREILIENPSSYLEYIASTQNEAEFLVRICQKTGAKILLDINNIFVSCSNHGWDAKAYIDTIPAGLVKEIHLAGHSIKEISTKQILRIDTHDNNVCQEVWDLYGYAIKKLGLVPTLLEWDAKIPDLDFLIKEASKALNYV